MDLYFIRKDKIIVTDSSLVDQSSDLGLCYWKPRDPSTKARGPWLGLAYADFSSAYWDLITYKKRATDTAKLNLAKAQSVLDKCLNQTEAKRVK